MIRVMSDGSLRERQRSDTRDQIRRAVLDLLESEMAATISVPAVAERAGVSLRTVYRYFPTKAELLKSSTDWQGERARELSQADPVRAGGIEPYLVALWEDFATNVAGVRALHHGALGREARSRRLGEFRDTLRAATARRLEGLDERERDDVIDLMIAVTSSSMFLELVDRMGHEPAHAARLAAHLSGVLMNDAEARRDTP